MTRLPSLAASVAPLALLLALGAPAGSASLRTLAVFDPGRGETPENLVVARGSVYVSLAFAGPALRRLARDERFAETRAGLLITDIVDVADEPYHALLEYEREAARLGYTVLA